MFPEIYEREVLRKDCGWRQREEIWHSGGVLHIGDPEQNRLVIQHIKVREDYS